MIRKSVTKEAKKEWLGSSNKNIFDRNKLEENARATWLFEAIGEKGPNWLLNKRNAFILLQLQKEELSTLSGLSNGLRIHSSTSGQLKLQGGWLKKQWWAGKASRRVQKDIFEEKKLFWQADSKRLH